VTEPTHLLTAIVPVKLPAGADGLELAASLSLFIGQQLGLFLAGDAQVEITKVERMP
jgi:hypothetical protein